MSYVHRHYQHIGLWVVGYFDNNEFGERIFCTLQECQSEVEAAAFINYLNGGNGKPWDWDE